MIANIRNIDGYVSGQALLPFFNNTVEIELDSDSQEDLEGNPLHILRFARLLNIHFDRFWTMVRRLWRLIWNFTATGSRSMEWSGPLLTRF